MPKTTNGESKMASPQPTPTTQRKFKIFDASAMASTFVPFPQNTAAPKSAAVSKPAVASKPATTNKAIKTKTSPNPSTSKKPSKAKVTFKSKATQSTLRLDLLSHGEPVAFDAGSSATNPRVRIGNIALAGLP